jgi:hypothetical protein
VSWAKDARKKNLGDHIFRSVGYEGKEAMWKKEDEQYAKEGVDPNPWELFTNECEHRFV